MYIHGNHAQPARARLGKCLSLSFDSKSVVQKLGDLNENVDLSSFRKPSPDSLVHQCHSIALVHIVR